MVADERRLIGADPTLVQHVTRRQRLSDAEQRMTTTRGSPRRRARGSAGAEPVARPLERVAGKLGPTRRRSAVAPAKGPPVDGRAGEIGIGQRLADLLEIVAAATERGDDAAGDRCGLARRWLLGRGEERRQHRMGPDLDDQVDGLRLQCPQAVGEAHGVARMTSPVPRRRDLAGGGQRAGDVRDQSESGRRPGQVRDLALERVQHRIEQRRMERVRDGQRLAPDSALEQRPRSPPRRRRRPPRSTVCAGPLTAPIATEPGVVARTARTSASEAIDGGHRTAGRQRLHQAAADRHQSQRIGEPEDAGDAGGDDLSDAVPDHHRRDDAPVAPEAAQRVLDGEQRRLRIRGLVEPARVVAFGEQDVEQGPFEQAAESGRAGVQRFAEYRFGLVEPARHPGVLRALAGEHESDPRRVAAREARGPQARGLAVARQRVERGPQPVDRTGQDGGPLGMDRAADVGRVAEIDQRRVLQLRQRTDVAPGEGGERRPRRRRQGEDLRRSGFRSIRESASARISVSSCTCTSTSAREIVTVGRRLLQHDVGIGSAEAERADAADPAPVDDRPGHRFARHLQRDGRPSGSAGSGVRK